MAQMSGGGCHPLFMNGAGFGGTQKIQCVLIATVEDM